MTLAELFQTIVDRQTFPPSQVKTIQTSIRYLATALSATDPAHCHLVPERLSLDAWLSAIDTYFLYREKGGQPVGRITARNTRSNLRRVHRAATAQALFTVPSQPTVITSGARQEFEAKRDATALYHDSYHPTGSPRKYGLQQRDWPADVQAGWRAYNADVNPAIRQVTRNKHATIVCLYLGYLKHYTEHEPSWEACFNKKLLQGFMRWHGARIGKQITTVGRDMVIVAALVAKVLGRKDARRLANWRNTLPAPDKVHREDNHMMSLAELEAIADGCLRDATIPASCPVGTKHPGAARASLFQKGLMLKIMIRTGLRQRNIREMKQPDNLFQDRTPDKHWHLRFHGKELKVGMRGPSTTNEYHINLSTETDGLVPVIEEFLNEWRKKLPGADTSPYVFLTCYGNPYSQHSLYEELRTLVGMRSGKGVRFFPHIVRSMVVTEIIDVTHDYDIAAAVVGDKPETLFKAYRHRNIKVFQTKGQEALRQRLGRTGSDS
jgi:hypothetical protein